MLAVESNRSGNTERLVDEQVASTRRRIVIAGGVIAATLRGQDLVQLILELKHKIALLQKDRRAAGRAN